MTQTALPTLDQIRALPKVSLHDHLDGGLRPDTIIELAGPAGHALPRDNPDELGQWFFAQANSGSLEAYLETFDHTLAVMQQAPNLVRVAREAIEDLAADGVVHAELRFAPELHQRGGLTKEQVLEAVLAGVKEGLQDTPGMTAGVIVCAMRQHNQANQIADLALRYRHRGVVGFDMAGPEAGHPPVDYLPAYNRLRWESFPITLHAGEADGATGIHQALHLAGALRIGHGVRITDNIEGFDNHELDDAAPRLGTLAQWVLDRAIPLEMCPTSNIQTGTAQSIATHPATALAKLGFAVTINPDNRLMSATSVSQELTKLVQQAGWTLDDVRHAIVASGQAAFLNHHQRCDLVTVLSQPM
jgi:adenosine deaminase